MPLGPNNKEVSIMTKRKFTKAIALFLAVVLTLGLLPFSVFAAGGGASGGSLVNPTQPGGTATGWNTARYSGKAITFTRYSLYKFPNSVDGSDWYNASEPLSSIDVVPDAQKVTIQEFGKIFWFDTDAGFEDKDLHICQFLTKFIEILREILEFYCVLNEIRQIVRRRRRRRR